MLNRGKLWVIPDEETIIQEVFERNVEKGKSHTYHLQEFSDIFQLGFKFSEDDYQTAPCEIASLGHLVLKSEDEVSLVVCYLPEKITDRQYNWLYNNQNLINFYRQVNGYSIRKNSDTMELKKIHGFSQIMQEAAIKNMLIEKRTVK